MSDPVDYILSRIESARHAMTQMESASREAAGQSNGYSHGNAAATYGDVAYTLLSAADWIKDLHQQREVSRLRSQDPQS
jgi:hypothetical protein